MIWHGQRIKYAAVSIRQTFDTFSTVGRRLIVASLLLGLVLLIAGTVIDIISPKWWQNLSYITGMLESLTGFLIGAPVALVALQSLLSDKDQAMQTDAVNRVTGRAWERFREEVIEVADLSRIFQHHVESGPRGRSDYTPLLEIYREVLIALEKYQAVKINPIAIDSFEKYKQHIYSAQRNLRSILFDYQTEFKLANKGGNLQKSWWNVISAWYVLNGYVRPRRAEHGLPWIDSNCDAILVEYLTKPANPVTEFFDAWGDFAEIAIALDAHLPSFKQHLDSFDKSRLDNLLLKHQEVMSEDYSDSLHRYMNEACDYLANLKACAERVDASGWPRAHTSPFTD